MDKISHYQILGTLGAGGMGEVFLAEDLRLGRKVALKILPETVAKDENRLARFQLEARSASALNHPNILTIYDIGEEKGMRYIISEYIEGKTIRRRMMQGPMNLEEVIEIGIQIAEALSVAHTAGIIHRDVKPENIMLRPDGYIKIVDFGLARPSEARLVEIQSESPTRVQTEPGVLLGTLHYSSPEQIRGQAVDSRTDIFSLGIVLHEMISGQRPFEGISIPDLMVAILQKDPPMLFASGHAVPERLQALILKALSKEAAQRWTSMEELLNELKEVRAEMQGQSGPRVQPKLTQLSVAEGVEDSPAWMPDGESIIFQREVSGLRKLFLKKLDSEEETQLTSGNYDDIQPSVSPDGETVLFVRAHQAGVKLEPTDVLGMQVEGDVWALHLPSGKERKLIQNAFNPVFSSDGSTIAVDASWAGPRRIWTVNAQGLNPQQITSDFSEESRHIRPQWSPDGNKIVFMNMERTKFDIRIVDITSRKILWMTNDVFPDYHPVWSPSGRYIYFSSMRGGGLNIWKMPVAVNGEPVGTATQLTTGAGQDLYMTISKDAKRMSFSVVRQNAALWRLPVSPDTGHTTGEAEAVITGKREDSRGAWSPDGSQIAFNSDRKGDMNIWIYSVVDRSLRQITKGPGGDYQPNWSPEGKRLLFFSSRSGTINIYKVNLETTELEQLTFGKSLNVNPFFSPDGHRIAFMSDQTGRLEVWIMNDDGTNVQPLTSCGTMGHFLRWTPDGQSILFRCYNNGKPQTFRISPLGGEPESMPEIIGGAHMSLAPQASGIMDVLGHKVLWMSPLKGGKPERIFEFNDPDVRIDYPVWSPDGRWILFDRTRLKGGDIWLMTDFE
ncbi:MAG: hypothetical protein C5B54_12120 [Acidobacteria bacterium]|nr:MAG: hypothetical protein C5B54_12120 [Acidobacteriota bacterium]